MYQDNFCLIEQIQSSLSVHLVFDIMFCYYSDYRKAMRQKTEGSLHEDDESAQPAEADRPALLLRRTSSMPSVNEVLSRICSYFDCVITWFQKLVRCETLNL